MIENNKNPKLVFEGVFDDREAMETRDRGYRSHVWVEFANGDRYAVVFYDAVRLQQDLMDEVSRGNPYIAEAGLIVLSEVTRQNMETAIRQLAEEGFFDSIRPADEHASSRP
jgi:hypothetical protein